MVSSPIAHVTGGFSFKSHHWCEKVDILNVAKAEGVFDR